MKCVILSLLCALAAIACWAAFVVNHDTNGLGLGSWVLLAGGVLSSLAAVVCLAGRRQAAQQAQ